MSRQALSPREISRRVRGNYNLIAREWDRTRAFPSALKVAMLREVRPGTRVLDLGCGNGLMVPYVLEKGATYVGVDFSEELLKIARKKYFAQCAAHQVEFILADVTELPVRQNEFDVVISFAVLHHLPSEGERRKFFSEIYRVLRPGGVAKIIVWNLLNDWAMRRFAISPESLKKNCGDVPVPWRAGGRLIERYVHQFSPAELKALASRKPFQKLKCGHYNRAGELTPNGEELVLETEK